MLKKRVLGILTAAVIATMSFAMPVSAQTESYDSSGHTFAKSWEGADAESAWTIKYGFNTSWINEDYTHTYHESLHHTATVSNANGAFSDEDKAGQNAGIEVTHSGSTVYYSISF